MSLQEFRADLNYCQYCSRERHYTLSTKMWTEVGVGLLVTSHLLNQQEHQGKNFPVCNPTGHCQQGLLVARSSGKQTRRELCPCTYALQSATCTKI